MAKQVCAVCGQGGYWVGFSAEHGEDRCVNHLDTIPRTSIGGCICDGGTFEVQRYPFIIHPLCAVHGPSILEESA